MLPEKPNYSLAEAAERIQCKPIDLLHYGVQKLITLYVGVPYRVDLRIYDEWTNQAFAPLLGQPQLLALEQSHCLNIETYGKTEQCDFPEGCSIESTGRLRTVRTSEGRPALNVRWVYWRTYRDGLIYPLLILPEHLFVLLPDLVKLMELAATKEGPRKTKSPVHKAVKQEIKERNGEFASPEAKTDDRPDSSTPAKPDHKTPTATDAEDEKSLKRQAAIAFNTPARSATILSIEQVVTQTGLSKFNIYDRLNENSPRYDPTFPKQVALGSEAVGWYADEIYGWVLSLRDKKFRWLGNWDSAMTPGNSSALNRVYYSLSEATKALKARGKSLSVYDLLHYGVQGTVRFFIHLPSGIRARQIHESPACENDPQPNLLILSPLQCVEIECNKHTECSDFPSAYTSLYSYAENPPYPQNIESLEQKYWQTIDSNDAIKQIPITPKTIYLAHTELTYLFQQLDSPYRPPIEFIPQFDEQLQQEIKLRCYSFEDALKTAKEKIDGFTEIDLLRYGYFEKLTFLIQHPKNLSISIAHGGNPYATNITLIPKPDLLALHPEDCYQIEIFGQTKRTDFKVGFLFHHRALIPIIPKQTPDLFLEILESSNLKFIHNYRLRVDTITNGSLRWRTYNQSVPYTIEINKNILYVIRSEFDRLIAEESIPDKIGQNKTPYTPEFTISEITKYCLSPKKFITLSDAANLAKCYTNELLIHASQGTIELLTPVPCEISLCQTRHPVDNINELRKSKVDIFASLDKIPQLLVLENADCEAIATNGHIKKGYFEKGYSFKLGQLVQQTPHYLLHIRGSSQANATPSDSEMPSGVWLTFYLDKPVEIDITVDRIFIELSKFQELIKSSPDIFKSKNDIFIETEPSMSDQLNSVSPETTSAVSCNPLRTNLTDDAVLPGDISAPIDNVTVKEFMELSGMSRTTIDNKSKNRDKYPYFPTKYKIEENGHVYFLKSEVDAWIRKNPPRNRKQNPP